MIHVKYVLMMESKNLLKQLVDIIYVINVSNNYIKKIIFKNVQYVEKRIGFIIMSRYIIL